MTKRQEIEFMIERLDVLAKENIAKNDLRLISDAEFKKEAARIFKLRKLAVSMLDEQTPNNHRTNHHNIHNTMTVHNEQHKEAVDAFNRGVEAHNIMFNL